MKLRNFANKLLLVILMMVIGWGQVNGGAVLAPLMAMAEDPGATTKTYYFNQYNNNTPTGQSLYESLGITVYNDYLAAVQETKALRDVVIAVVDSGLNPAHPVFQDRIITEHAFDFSHGLSSTTKQDGLWDDWNQDHNGHGTHVAGIIADMTLPNVKILPIKIFNNWDNQGSSYAFDNAVRYLCALKTGEEMMLVNEFGEEQYRCNTEHHQLNIVAVNLSLGTEGYSIYDDNDLAEFNKDKYGYTQDNVTYSGYQDVIDRLLRKNILPIVAAGNYGSTEKSNGIYYSLPGACDGVLAVSAYDNTQVKYERAEFSFYNNFIGISAPGKEIWSACSGDIAALFEGAVQGNSAGQFKTIKRNQTDKYGLYDEYAYNYQRGLVMKQVNWVVRQDNEGNYYLRNNGTSMATPFVSACYAMLMSDTSKESEADFGLPVWDGAEGGVDEHFINVAHKAMLAAAATNGDQSVEGYDEYFGYGTVNVACFAQAEMTPLKVIKYEITPSRTSKLDPKDPITYQETDWFEVICILFVGGILVWGFGYFKSYFTRGKTHDSNESQQS